MQHSREAFNRTGFAIINAVLSEASIRTLISQVGTIHSGKAGTRNLLLKDWCSQLAIQLKHHPALQNLLPDHAVAVQCTYFDKSIDRNWLVPLHRDRFIPVKQRLNRAGWSSWSIKEGAIFVRPPKVVLESLIAVRLHLDDSFANNGPLEVVSGSHLDENLAAIDRKPCYVAKGGVLVLKPLVLHASSKLKEGRRRVLHFLYASPYLPDGLEWAIAV